MRKGLAPLRLKKNVQYGLSLRYQARWVAVGRVYERVEVSSDGIMCSVDMSIKAHVKCCI
jgi:hypothetical protein